MLKSYVTEEVLPAADLNQLVEGSGFKFDLNAGEVINGATLPVPVYQDTTDGELYACDANVTTKLNFLGFAISNSTNGNPIVLQTEGILGGFTGLTKGVKYYVQDAVGTIGVNPGTYEVLVGRAISTTEILIEKKSGPIYKNGTFTKDMADASATQTIAHGLGRIPRKVRIKMLAKGGSANNNVPAIAEAVYNGTTQSSVSFGIFQTNGDNTEVSNSFKLRNYSAGGGDITGVITTDDTNIYIAWTKTGYPTTVADGMWEAEV